MSNTEKRWPVGKGFVETRNTPEARRAEIEAWSNDPWYPILSQLDEDIAALVPDYSLDQLKEKFNSLRFYVTLPEGTEPETSRKVNRLIRQAEAAANNE